MYKIVQNNKVIDIVQKPCYIRFLPSGHIAVTDKTSAQGIVGSDRQTVYHFETSSTPETAGVTIKKVTLEEFNKLQGLLNSSQEIVDDENLLNSVRQAKIAKLSESCKTKITDGFSVRLSDGKTHNFKLTTEDQLNLLMIEGQLNTGKRSFIYHATDQPCRAFTREDMIKIITMFRDYTLYHTTYFNIAKQYIKSLIDLEKINRFEYGMDVSSVTKDATLKKILKNKGGLR